jgi:hypothetical protein
MVAHLSAVVEAAMDDELAELVKRDLNATEVYRVVGRFEAYRNGTGQHVVVEVLDRGDPHAFRWQVQATDDDGREASGNGGATPAEAFASVHWETLDAPVDEDEP